MGAITDMQVRQFEQLSTYSDQDKSAVLAEVLGALEECLEWDGKLFNARIVREVRELLGRLTRPLTLDECREILNANRYCFNGTWGQGYPWEPDADYGTTLTDGDESLTLFEATALARAFLAQGGAS